MKKNILMLLSSVMILCDEDKYLSDYARHRGDFFCDTAAKVLPENQKYYWSYEWFLSLKNGEYFKRY